MNFDLSWFTTVPGLFITAGVLLLIVALIILIVTGKKSKKEKKAKEAEQNVSATPTMTGPVPVNQGQNMNSVKQTTMTDVSQPAMPEVAMNQIPQQVMPEASMPEVQQQVIPEQNSVVNPMEIPANNMNSMTNMVQQPNQFNQQVVAPNQEQLTNESQPVTMNEVQQKAFEPQPVAPQPVVTDTMNSQQIMPEPIVNEPSQSNDQAYMAMPNNNQMLGEVSQPTTQDASLQQVAPETYTAMPNVNPMPEVTPLPVNQQPAISQQVPAQPFASQSVQQEVTNQQPEHVIYGGADPSAANINFNQEAPHQIYGGADPMANTQTIPTIQVENNPAPVVNSSPVIQPVSQVAPQPVQSTPVNVVPQITPSVPINQSQQ